MYDKTGAEMVKAGFQHSGVQCREKIKKIKGDYKKVKDKCRRTGEGLYPIWDYFDAIDAILGNKHATELPVVVNNLKDPESDQSSPDSPGPFDQTKIAQCRVRLNQAPQGMQLSHQQKRVVLKLPHCHQSAPKRVKNVQHDVISLARLKK